MQIKLHKKMQDQVAVRNQTQPIKERTAGSTFKNPSGLSSTGEQTDTHEFKAWKLIEDRTILQGCVVSENHSAFVSEFLFFPQSCPLAYRAMFFSKR